MVDLYMDGMSLVRVYQKHGSQLLVFQNKEKDEMITIPINKEELLNIYHRIKIRCEALDLLQKS